MALLIGAVTTVLGELLKVILEVKTTAEKFEDVLQSMEVALNSIIPLLKKLEGLNEALDCEDDKEITKFWKQIEQGKKLVRKCSEINCWFRFFKMSCFTRDLEKLDRSLKNFCQIVLPLIQLRLQRLALLQVEGIHHEVEDIHDEVEDIHDEVEDIHDEVEGIHDEVESIHDKVDYIHDNVEDIHDEVEGIHDNVEGIHAEVEGIHAEVEDIHDTVEDMHDKVEGIHEKVEDIHDEVEGTNVEVKEIHEELKETYGKVKDIHEDVKGLQKDLQLFNPANRVFNNTAPLPPCAPPDPPKHTVGLDKPLMELKNVLLKDGVSVVVLSAPGGCGKTTLAIKLCQDEEIKGKFKENVFFVTVGKTPNLKAIIQQLFLHKGYLMQEFQSDEEAVNRLQQLLKQIGPEPILLVLDDVWPESECLLEKFNFQIPEYKVLVTSISTFPRFGNTYKLETLKNEDSMSFFRHSAGLQDETSNVIERDVVEKVVNACKGFPLALRVVGRSLHGQPVAIWRQRVKKWLKGGSIFESNIDLLNCLKSSLDALDDKLKECYMDLGAFPEGQLIPAATLIDMWEELYEPEDNGMANIHKLSSLNLVNVVVTRNHSSEAEDYYNNHFVMQHDLLREMVNHLSGLDGTEQRKRLVVEINGNEFPKWWGEQKQQHISARLLSISTDDTFSSKWHSMQAPGVEVLILNLRSKNYTLPNFMMIMDKLKALIVTNYGFSPSEISNFSFLCHLSNLKRIRLEQVLVPSLNLTSVQLKNLQKISLLRCNMGQDFGRSIFQISPNLVEINIGYCTHLVELPIELSDIVHLRKLYITYCDDLSMLPEGIGNLVNLEALRLTSCTKLSELPYTIGKLNMLNILDISDCISIKKLPEEIGDLQNLRKIYMAGCSNCELPKSITKLVHLKSVMCDEETAKSWTPLKCYFSNLSIKS